MSTNGKYPRLVFRYERVLQRDQKKSGRPKPSDLLPKNVFRTRGNPNWAMGPRGGTTEATIKLSPFAEISGKALCSFSNRFHKETGRSLAIARLLAHNKNHHLHIREAVRQNGVNLNWALVEAEFSRLYHGIDYDFDKFCVEKGA